MLARSDNQRTDGIGPHHDRSEVDSIERSDGLEWKRERSPFPDKLRNLSDCACPKESGKSLPSARRRLVFRRPYTGTSQGTRHLDQRKGGGEEAVEGAQGSLERQISFQEHAQYCTALYVKRFRTAATPDCTPRTVDPITACHARRLIGV